MLSRCDRLGFRPAPCGVLAATRLSPAGRARGSYRGRRWASRRRSPRCPGPRPPSPAPLEPQALTEPGCQRQGMIPLAARRRLQRRRDRMAASGSVERVPDPTPERVSPRPAPGPPDAAVQMPGTTNHSWRESRPGARFLKELPRCGGRSPPRPHASMESPRRRQGRNWRWPSIAAHL